jgi:hypothetical protein
VSLKSSSKNIVPLVDSSKISVVKRYRKNQKLFVVRFERNMYEKKIGKGAKGMLASRQLPRS